MPNRINNSQDQDPTDKMLRNRLLVFGAGTLAVLVWYNSNSSGTVENDFRCEGMQNITAQSGDTYGKLIAQNTDLDGANYSQINQIIKGLSFNEYNGDPVNIEAGINIPPSRDITANKIYIIPTNCIKLQN